MKTRFLTEGSTLIEQYCIFVPESSFYRHDLYIQELIEQTDEYEVYKCCDEFGLFGMTVKVYINNNVRAGGKLLIGKSSDVVRDISGKEQNKICVFEILDGENEYRDYFYTPQENESNERDADDEPVDDSKDDSHYTQETYVDEDTGELYTIDDQGNRHYITENGIPIETETATEKEKKAERLRGFAAVAGMDKLKKEMLDEVKFVLDDPERARRYKLHVPNGMLLYGPPGCGKTYFAERFAEELGVRFYFRRASDIVRHYLHQTTEEIGALFNQARQCTPCIICIDEIDALVPARKEADDSGGNDINASVDEFLSQMSNCGRNGIMVVGTTNHPSLLDPAVLRTGRMDKLVEIPLPDLEARTAMLNLLISDVPHEKDIDFDKVSEACEGMVMSDMECMFHSVLLKAAHANVDISEKMLVETAKNARRSVKPEHEENGNTRIHKLPPIKIKGFASVG